MPCGKILLLICEIYGTVIVTSEKSTPVTESCIQPEDSVPIGSKCSFLSRVDPENGPRVEQNCRWQNVSTEGHNDTWWADGQGVTMWIHCSSYLLAKFFLEIIHKLRPGLTSLYCSCFYCFSWNWFPVILNTVHLLCIFRTLIVFMNSLLELVQILYLS